MTRRSVSHVRLYRNIQKTLSENVQILGDVKKILLAFSGGVDSVVLFHLLLEICKKRNIELAAVHVHHGVRGKEADEDAQFCRQFARAVNVPFYLESLPVRLPSTPEHLLRKGRYESLVKVAKRVEAQRIFLAHHQDDQAETVLFRFLTGTDLSGLRGMKVFRPPYFVRPMLNVSKKDILREAQQCSLLYRTDSSNAKTHVRRNFLREHLIPLLETQINPKIRTHLSYLSDTFTKCHELVELKIDEAQSAITLIDQGYSVAQWRKVKPYIRSGFISRLYRSHRKDSGVLRRMQIILVEKLLLSKNPYGEVHLPAGVRCVKMKDKFYFEG